MFLAWDPKEPERVLDHVLHYQYATLEPGIATDLGDVALRPGEAE